MIEFKMLGEIRLKAADGTELDAILRQPKRLAVLSYLAAPAPGTRHRRDLLLALFWPELDTAHARTSLRNAIYVLRQSLGETVLLSSGDEEIAVNPELLKTDLAVVYTALREGRIDDALAAYGGELLPGLFPSDSEGFLRWLDSERTRLKVAISSAATGRLNELESRKDLPQALSIARRMLEIQPDDETIVRRVMTLHESLGDMAGGLNVFEKYRARLAADFDAAPSPETSALAERLRSAPRPSTNRNKSSAVRNTRIASDASEPDAILPAVSPVQDSPRRWVIPVLGAVVLAVAAIGGWALSRPAVPMSLGASAPLTTEEGLQVEPAISPDGRMVAYAKGNVAHLKIYVRTIGGGPPWPLTTDSVSHEVVPRWSPHSDKILFLSRNNAYVTTFIGGEPRLVARGTGANGIIRSASWPPHGDSLAFVRNDSLMVKPLDGSKTRLIGTGSQLHSCVWSPNGKWIACVSGNWLEFEAGPLFGNDAPCSILIFPASGGKAIALTDAEHEHRSPAWSPDSRFLWVLSDRDGSVGSVYAIPIGRNGHAAGPFIPVGLTAEWIGLSENRIAYSVPYRYANLWTVPIPRASVATLKDADTLTSGKQLIETLSVSRDQKWLLFDSNKRGNADIFRMRLPQGEPEPLTSDPRPEYGADLSPDGTELAWHRWIDGKRHIVTQRLDGDSAQLVFHEKGDNGVPRWSPDGTAIAGWNHNNTEGDVFVVRRDASGKWGKRLWQVANGQLPAWSPDGKTIAFVRYDGSVQTIPADSGALTSIYTPRPGSDDPIAIYVVWSLSPDSLWFLGRNKSSGRGTIWSVNLKTGAKKLLVSIEDRTRLAGFTMVTDQRRFYFTLDERFSNVRWATLVKH